MNLTSNNIGTKPKLTLSDTPYLIELQTEGNPESGFLSVAHQNDTIPFDVKRIYWTYGVPDNHTRGHHAHFSTKQILVAVSGTIIVELESVEDLEKTTFVLDNPQIGLFIPPKTWRTLHYHHQTVQLVIASNDFCEKDYIRDYQAFKKLNIS